MSPPPVDPWKVMLHVASRWEAERGMSRPIRHVVISVTDPDLPPAALPRDPNRLDVLELKFHDIEPFGGDEAPLGFRRMTPADADAVWAFVWRHLPSVEAIVAHCEQGVSRSAAIGAAVAEALGHDPTPLLRGRSPNPYVYRLLRESLARGASGE